MNCRACTRWCNVCSISQIAFRISLFASYALCQETGKRGLAYLGDSYSSDNSLLLSQNSPISWIYNWSPYPPRLPSSSNNPEFIPLIHGIDTTSDDSTFTALKNLPDSSRHLLTFNEPDGTTSSGGSAISPEDAARAYIDHIVPLRNGDDGRRWLISHPSVTGSPRGLDWLRDFNTACFDIDSSNGCPTDFIAAHWYGAFEGLASWLGSLDDFYNADRSDSDKLRIWVTEMALPQASAEDTTSMMNQTLPYLDGLESVERYAWFGAFRTDDANQWTGDGVALFNGDGGLTECGALYLGGEGSGFSVGQQGEGNGDANGDQGAAVGLHINSGLIFGSFVLGIVLCTRFW